MLFSLAAKIVRLSPKLQAVITIRDTAKELLCPRFGTSYKALSAEVSHRLWPLAGADHVRRAWSGPRPAERAL